RLAASGWGGIVHLVDVRTGRLLFSTHPVSVATRLRFDLTGARLATARLGGRNERIGLWSVADARGDRALGPPRGAASQGNPPTAVHRNGRLAAYSTAQGVTLFDLESGEEVAALPFPPAVGGEPGLAFDGTGALLINSFAGLLRWPVRADPAKAGRWTV